MSADWLHREASTLQLNSRSAALEQHSKQSSTLLTNTQAPCSGDDGLCKAGRHSLWQPFPEGLDLTTEVSGTERINMRSMRA